MLLFVTILREKLVKYQLGKRVVQRTEICENDWSPRVGMRGTKSSWQTLTPGALQSPDWGQQCLTGSLWWGEKSPPHHRLELICCQRALQQRRGALDSIMRQPWALVEMTSDNILLRKGVSLR